MNDDQVLAGLEAKLQILTDRVRGAAEGFSAGLYLWGPGGTGKSHAVEDTLRQAGKPFKLSNSRLSARGLVELLHDYPDVVHVIDAAEPLLFDKHAQGVLRSALWGQPGGDGRQERKIVWQVARAREDFLFQGSLIVIANVRLTDVPQLRALQTRIPVIHYAPSNEELAAMMRRLDLQGYRHGPHRLSQEQCLEVVEEIVEGFNKVEKNLDLRVYVGACQDRLQAEAGAARTDWRDLVASRLKQRVLHPGEGGYKTRAERWEDELALVRRIMGLPAQERLAIWQRETGKSQAVLYRRLEEVNCGGRGILFRELEKGRSDSA